MRRATGTRRRRIVRTAGAFVGAVAVAAGSYAAAASLALTSGSLGSGNVSVPACDTDGFAYTHTLDASHQVATVTVSSIDAACAGGTLQVTLANSSNLSIGYGSGAIAGTSVTLTITGSPASSSVIYYRSAVST